MSAKIAVIGTCQVASIGLALQKLIPDSVVNAWHVNNPDPPEVIAEKVTGYDVVFSQMADPSCSILLPEQLKAKVSAIVMLPTIVFNGLQPDCVYLIRSGNI